MIFIIRFTNEFVSKIAIFRLYVRENNFIIYYKKYMHILYNLCLIYAEYFELIVIAI